MAACPQKHLTDDERRAPQLLAVNPHGATVEALVLGHGFKLQMLDDLVRARLAKRYRVTVTADGQTTGVTVTYMKIMAAGRNAIEEREMMAVSPLGAASHPRAPPGPQAAREQSPWRKRRTARPWPWLQPRGTRRSRPARACSGRARGDDSWRQGDGGRSGQDYGGGAECNRGMKATA
jgi:hypothetical protein